MTILKPNEYQMLTKTVHNVRCHEGYAEITFTDGEHCWFEKYTEEELRVYFAEILKGE